MNFVERHCQTEVRFLSQVMSPQDRNGDHPQFPLSDAKACIFGWLGKMPSVKRSKGGKLRKVGYTKAAICNGEWGVPSSFRVPK